MYLGSVKFFKHLIYAIGILLVFAISSAVIWGIATTPSLNHASMNKVQSEQIQTS